MTRDEMLTLLLRRAGQREGDTKLQNQLIEESKLVQDNLEQNGVQIQGGGVFWPNFLVSEISTASTTADEPRVDLPADFLMEVEEGALFYKDSSGSWHTLQKEFWDSLKNAGLGEGKPEYYAMLGDYFYIFPTPDASYTLKLIYFQQDTKLSDNVENRWLRKAPGLFLSKLGAVMAEQYLYDNQLAQRFQKEEAEAAIQLYNAEVAREQANFAAIKGV